MHAVFYCENCRKPVSLEAVECPHCGSRFTAVQCPRCSFVGEARSFSEGCPQCGFLAPTAGGSSENAAPKQRRPRTASPASSAAKNTRAGGPEKGGRSPGLPGWFYLLASIFLALVLIGLVVVILRLR